MPDPAAATTTTEPTISVFALIHELHATISKSIDTSLSWDQLNSPPVNYTLIRPIVERLTPSVQAQKGDSERERNGGGPLLSVPKTGSGAEEDGTGGKIQSGGTGLGMVLYALMANRYVHPRDLPVLDKG